MNNLAHIKKRFFTILTVLAVIDLVFLVYLLWPGSSSSGRHAREQALTQQERSLTREVGPLKNIDQELLKTRSDISTFYSERVPDRWSEISAELIKLTHDAGVTPQSIHYTAAAKSEKDDLQGVQRVGIETSVTGEYGKVARFINSLEQDKLMFIIETVTLTGKEGGAVTLEIKFQTFLKEAAQERAQS
jgi:Tfp pilus assembly protein PilO